MKRVLVVGEHSYIGTSFGEYVKKNVSDMEVSLIGARDKSWTTKDFSQYDTILHTAAIVHKKEQPDMQQMYYEVNTQFPVELAKKAKDNGVKQFVFFSTMAVYGNQPSPIGHNTPTEPVTLYGKSKLAAEQRLQNLADGDFKVIVLRPPMVYGAGCPGNYGRLAKLAYKLPFFPKIKNQRSMIHIENLCECMIQEIVREGAPYRIVCPQNAGYVNTTELVQEIRRVHGKKTLIIPFPQMLMRFCAAKIDMIEKVFGDCYYEKKESDKCYQIVDFKSSIEHTENAAN